jgi:hypothetical protein
MKCPWLKLLNTMLLLSVARRRLTVGMKALALFVVFLASILVTAHGEQSTVGDDDREAGSSGFDLKSAPLLPLDTPSTTGQKQIDSTTSSKGEEYKGGVADLLLPSSELGTNWHRNVTVLIDPLAHPAEVFKPEPARGGSPRKLWTNHLQNTHSEAVIEAVYYRASHSEEKWFVEIDRFGNPDLAHKTLDRSMGEHKKIGDLEVVYLKPGGLPYGLIGGTLSLVQGRYLVSISPTKPDSDTFGSTIAQLTAARIAIRLEKLK